jgi:ribosomal protein S18 acetylase RimI-like enzyme
MATAAQLEVLDLRHFNAVRLRPLLEEEGRAWSSKLWWDYRKSIELLLGYFDAHTLPGYVAMEEGNIRGYTFCVYDGPKAIIGDVFALPPRFAGPLFESTETLLLRHLLETLQNSPQVQRIESQLLLPDYGTLRAAFVPAGFKGHRRLLLEHIFDDHTPQWHSRKDAWRSRVTLRHWQDEDFPRAGALINLAYHGHVDANINDQYRTVSGAQRFLHNIVRFPGCGSFDPALSRIACDTRTGEMAGMVLASRVRADVGHITQLCVLPEYRRLGLSHALLDAVEADLRYQRFAGVTLTVTAENTAAIGLYSERGFRTRHEFEAFVWER